MEDMPFKRYVEIGRVALVNYGKDYGKLVVIVDVVDQNRALVDAPDMVRGQMNFKRLTLTDITIDIPRVPKKKTLIEAMEKADVKNKWENSSWGRKLIVQKRRAALTDFDRFKLMLVCCTTNTFTCFTRNFFYHLNTLFRNFDLSRRLESSGKSLQSLKRRMHLENR
ncbi:60S ribosomal protein L14-1-like [Gossypium australe]|uniref:60S ribosomal protein L14-1-like n=1 Tax=Gossypium australe TaxID=47621 RepID=A0A5B6WVL2_9ROSI|nr:60S ribosomal protein L14-1-like [Gossypium australe]